VEKGPLTGYPVVNFRFVLEDGQTHVVDSSSNAFNTATKYAFNEAFKDASPSILEPIMSIEVTVPAVSYVLKYIIYILSTIYILYIYYD
jgi:elongation factor G